MQNEGKIQELKADITELIKIIEKMDFDGLLSPNGIRLKEIYVHAIHAKIVSIKRTLRDLR